MLPECKYGMTSQEAIRHFLKRISVAATCRCRTSHIWKLYTRYCKGDMISRWIKVIQAAFSPRRFIFASFEAQRVTSSRRVGGNSHAILNFALHFILLSKEKECRADYCFFEILPQKIGDEIALVSLPKAIRRKISYFADLAECDKYAMPSSLN